MRILGDFPFALFSCLNFRIEEERNICILNRRLNGAPVDSMIEEDS